MKVVRRHEGSHFEPKNHWGCWPIRQHGKEQTGTHGMWTAISTFLPEGGGKDDGLPPERIYYILSGTMTVKTGDQQVTLNEGDSVYRPPNEPGEYWNSGRTPCVALIIVVPKE